MGQEKRIAPVLAIEKKETIKDPKVEISPSIYGGEDMVLSSGHVTTTFLKKLKEKYATKKIIE